MGICFVIYHKGSPKNFSFDKLGLLDQPGGRGLTEDQLFCKIVKTKLTFVNGQKFGPQNTSVPTKKMIFFHEKIKCLE